MQGLIIAFIIITFIYRVYKNFKKEAEKAVARAKEADETQKAIQKAKATEDRKTQPYTTFEPAVEQPYQTSYDKALAQEYTPAPVFESHKEDYKREKAKEKAARAANVVAKKAVADYYNPEVPADEVIENRRAHQPHHHSFNFPKKKEANLAAGFNFKQALIYDAILRRPEY